MKILFSKLLFATLFLLYSFSFASEIEFTGYNNQTKLKFNFGQDKIQINDPITNETTSMKVNDVLQLSGVDYINKKMPYYSFLNCVKSKYNYDSQVLIYNSGSADNSLLIIIEKKYFLTLLQSFAFFMSENITELQLCNGT